MMKVRRTCRWLSVTLLLAAGTVGLSGCLVGEPLVSLRYDKDNDSFGALIVYQRIRPDKQNHVEQELQQLEALWANRDHLLMLEPFRFLSGPPAWVRISDSEYRSVSLETASLAPAIRRTRYPLSSIEIRPGALFTGGEGNLCYYHQIIIPGRLIDMMLADAKQVPADGELRTRIRLELSRREAGKAKGSWEDLERRAAAPGDAGAENSEAWQRAIAAMETESLRVLEKSLGDGSFALERKGQVFRLRLPMTEGDAGRLAAILDGKLQRELDADRRARFAQAISIKGDGNGLSITVDAIAAAAQILHDLSTAFVDQALDPEQLASARVMAEHARKRLPVNTTMTVEQVMADFQAGTLKAHPSTRPVKPGQGLTLQPPDPK